jgi:hypothetical protein
MRKIMAHWRELPEHLRRGLLRLYVVVSVPWVVWFGYQLLDHLHRPYFSRSRHAAEAFWWLLLVPVGGPILLLVIAWVVAGFQKKPLGVDEATEDKAAPQSDSSAPHRPTGDYYSVIARGVSKLPDNTVEARYDLYDRARTSFAAQLNGHDPSWIKYERRTFERAIRQVELKSPRRWNRSQWQTYGPASTFLLIASIIYSRFIPLWAMDCTSMSLYWVVARLPKMPKWRVPKPIRVSQKETIRLLAKFG